MPDTPILADERWLLWAPAGMLCGIALSFWLPGELPWAALAVAVPLLALLPRRLAALRVLGLALLAVAAGFALARWEDWRLETPTLAKKTDSTTVTGVVEAVERRAGRMRIVLVDVTGYGLEALPERVRIGVVGEGGLELARGERVRLRTTLNPPPLPARPGGSDFARSLHLGGIGGIGITDLVDNPLRRVGQVGEAGPAHRLADFLTELRAKVSQRILAALPAEPQGQIATALLTGHRDPTPAEVLEAIHGAGLAHLLAISGLHVGLVAAIAFFAARALLVAVKPGLPVKAWAAMAALAASFLYLLLSGAALPAQRAFLMVAIALGVVAIGQPISLRLVALAAMAIMAVTPHAVTEAGFQLSFAAVVALVAAYEALRDRRSSVPPRVLYPAGVALTTAIAAAATTPLALALFGRAATYGGLLANLLAVPVAAFWVMPWGMAALVLMPLGLEGWALAPMAWGIGAILWIAGMAAGGDIPLTVLDAPPWFSLAYGLALIWLCVRRRLLALAPFAGLVAVLAAPPSLPDLLVKDGGDIGLVMAARTGEREIAFSDGPLQQLSFRHHAWWEAMGKPTLRAWPAAGKAPAGDRLRCDADGCLLRAGAKIAIAHGMATPDCRQAGLAVSLAPPPRSCPAPLGTIDRFDLWHHGTHGLRFADGAVRVATAAAGRGRRPGGLQ